MKKGKHTEEQIIGVLKQVSGTGVRTGSLTEGAPISSGPQPKYSRKFISEKGEEDCSDLL
jgi:hypothetical protein